MWCASAMGASRRRSAISRILHQAETRREFKAITTSKRQDAHQYAEPHATMAPGKICQRPASETTAK
jgi:hypothetical protein